jgi:hypothetical protein
MLHPDRGGPPDSQRPRQCPVLRTTSQWFGVTYPADKPFVVESIRKLIAAGEYPEKLVLSCP